MDPPSPRIARAWSLMLWSSVSTGKVREGVSWIVWIAGRQTVDLHRRVMTEINNCLSLFLQRICTPPHHHPAMESSPAPSDKNDRHDDFPENRDLKRTKVAHEVTTSREGTHGPASSDGHRSPAASTSRATSVGSPEKPKSDGGSLVKSVVKKNAKSKKAPDSSGSRKVGKRSSSKVRFVGGTSVLCACSLLLAASQSATAAMVKAECCASGLL